MLAFSPAWIFVAWSVSSCQVASELPEAPAPIATPVVGLNIKHEEIEALATPRTIEGIAQLSPGVSENAPNQGTTGGSVGQIIINGAFAFDNVFMINGVDINDNLFAQPQNLFIEDAIEETQVLTSGISAECYPNGPGGDEGARAQQLPGPQ